MSNFAPRQIQLSPSAPDVDSAATASSSTLEHRRFALEGVAGVSQEPETTRKRYICIGYFNKEAMDNVPAAELRGILRKAGLPER